MHCELNFDEPSISYSIGQQRTEPVKGHSQPPFFRSSQGRSGPTEKPLPFQQEPVYLSFG